VRKPQIDQSESLVACDEVQFRPLVPNLVTGDGRTAISGKAYPYDALKVQQFCDESKWKHDREDDYWLSDQGAES